MSDNKEAAPKADTRKHGRGALALVVVISLLNSMASMIVVPVLPKLVESFTGDASHAAPYIGYFAATFALIQFIASPVLGSLSDAYGRRTVILISAFGMAGDYLLMALSPTIGWLFVARMLSGVTAASGPAVNAYIADVIPPEERAGAFGWTGAAFAIGFLVGPTLGGLLGDISPRLPFWVSAGLCLAVAMYGWFILPESLPKARRTPFTFARANPVGSFIFLAERPHLVGLTSVQMMMMIAAQCLPTTIVLYTGARYGWTTGMVGVYLTFAGVGHLVVQSLVVRRFVGRFGERAAAVFGFSAVAIGFTVYATAPIAPLFATGLPLYALAGLVGPAIQSQLTRSVAPTEQGRLQGTLAAITALVGMVAPIMFTQLFSYAAGRGRGLVPIGLHLYVGAAILAAGAVLAAKLMRRQPTPEPASQPLVA